MKVSVITVSYNSAETIAETLQSVVAQDYPDIELIVVDGQSTDETIDIVKGFGDAVRVFVSEPDNGIYDAMNKGISLASGELIGILNSDDLYHDATVISDVVNLIKRSKSDSCYADLVYVHRVQTNKVVRTWVAGEYRRERFINGWMPPHPTFFVKKKCYQQFGSFNTEFSTSADYEIMLRMLYKHSVSAVYLNRTIVRMRAGGQSNNSLWNRIRANREDRRAWKVNDLEMVFLTTIKKPLSKLGQFFKR